MVKAIGKGALILLAGMMTEVALLWISYLLPVTEESVHVAESTLLLEQEGWYPTIPLMHQYQNNDVPSGINPGGILDNFTEELCVNNLFKLRRIFLRECCSKIRRIAGYVTDF